MHVRLVHLRRGLIAAFATLFYVVISGSSAHAAPFCTADGPASFQGGFSSLSDRLGPLMGSPRECEHTDPSSGDTHQHTTAGLAFYRRSTNTPTFTNGSQHWALTSYGLVRWEGAAIDPPVQGLHLLDVVAVPPPPGSGFDLHIVAAPENAAAPWCLAANPSCGRDPWWYEHNERDDVGHTQFAFLAPGLVVEAKFAEVIRLLWQWEQGAQLLRELSLYNVQVISAPEGDFPNAFATYSPAGRLIRVNSRFTSAPTWMLAAVFAHELRHAADHQAGARGRTSEACLSLEQRAYREEAAYLGWITSRFGELPSFGIASTRYTRDDMLLLANLYAKLYAEDLEAEVAEDYEESCAR